MHADQIGEARLSRLGMVLLAGTIDLGRAFFTWLTLRDAAQEGASYGSINSTDVSGINSRVWDILGSVIPDPQHAVSVEVTATGHCLGNSITVNVEYPQFPLTMPFLGILIGNTIPIHATINDTILVPPCGN